MWVLTGKEHEHFPEHFPSSGVEICNESVNPEVEINLEHSCSS
jgi:hypothetical protein